MRKLYSSPFKCKVRQTAGFPYYPSGKKHSGVDYVPLDKTIEENWFIYSPCSGRISYLYDDVYGNYVIIQTGTSTSSYYILMAHFDSFTEKKQVVCEGDFIGIAGSTGNSTGRHLHTEIYIYENGQKTRFSPDYFISFIGDDVMWKNGSTVERLYPCADHALYQFDDVSHLVLPPRKEAELLKIVYVDEKPVYCIKVNLGCGTCTGFVKYKGGVQ